MSARTVVPSHRSHASGSAGHRHLVEFYETDAHLAGAVARFLAPDLTEPKVAIVVASPAHCAAFDGALTASGVDVAGEVAAGRYRSYDAAEMLATFTVDGKPDGAAFHRAVNGLLECLPASGRGVRIYGEMVALLWEAGDLASAVVLEDLWNDISSRYDVELLCAYRLGTVDSEDDALAFRRICDQHESRPEQLLLAELAYANVLTTVINRRTSAAGPLAATPPHRREVDSLILADWRNASQLRASPGGRVLGDIVATQVATDG